MKTPLRYQVSEFDCGTVSLQNALSYLFDRETIPLDLVKSIHMYAVDCYGDDGSKSNDWLSQTSINRLCPWITGCTRKKNFNLDCTYLKGEEVQYDLIEKCIQNNGVVFIKCLKNKEYHFVIITNINKLNTYMFDPYYVTDEDYEKDDEVRVIQSKPMDYNIIVRDDRVFSTSNKDFALGDTFDRECVLMNKK